MICNVIDLGLTNYLEAYNFQKKLLEDIKSGDCPGSIIFCQHNRVITLGRLANQKNILVDQDFLKQRNIPIYFIDRGGDVTFHGPGQLVIWPLIDLKKYKKDLHNFLEKLEEVVIYFLKDFGIKTEKLKGKRGVFVNKDKIASMGIGVSNWVTFHGIALNITKELEEFKFLRPCGQDIEMTSLEKILNYSVSLTSIKEKILEKFKIIFGFDFVQTEAFYDASYLA